MSFQVVSRRVEIDAPLAAVLSLTLDAERYPEFAPSIDKATLLNHDVENSSYSIRYESTIPVIKIKAISEQEVRYNIAETIFHFRETKGTFGRFEGFRRLVALEQNRSAIESEVRYSFGGNRLVAAMMNKATQSVVQTNLEHIQDGIKRLAEADQAEPLHIVLTKLSVTPAMLRAKGVTDTILQSLGIADLAFA